MGEAHNSVNNGEKKLKKPVSAVDSIALNVFKSITVPASYLKALPKFLQKNSKQKRYPKRQSVILHHDVNELYIRRKGYEKELVTSFDGFQTITEIFSNCVKAYSHKHFIGTRVIHKKEITKTNDNKELVKLTLGHFEWESYGEIWKKIESYCAFFKSISVNLNEKIAIWADTCGDWLCICLAMMYMKIQVVTVYSTLVDDAIVYALNHTKASGIFVDMKSSKRLFQLLSKIPYIKQIFLVGNFTKADLDIIPSNITKPTLFEISKKFVYPSKINRPLTRYERIPKALKKVPLFYSIYDEDNTSIHDNISTNIEPIVNATNPVKSNTPNEVVSANLNETALKLEDINVNSDEKCKNDNVDKVDDDSNSFSTSSSANSITNETYQSDNNIDSNLLNSDASLLNNEKVVEDTKYDLSQLPTEASNDKPIQCYHISQFIVDGKRYLKTNSLDLQPINKEDIAAIMFTSGSTGIPKGVVIQHKSIAASVGAASSERDYWYDAIYAAYLPLAHIFEFVAELSVAAVGGAIGYCSPLTLTDTSPMVAPGSKGDFSELKPTIGVFVPLLLERIKKGVVDKVSQRGNIASSILNYSVKHTKKMRGVSSDAPLVEKFAFSKVRNLIGGHFRWAISGGAPLSPVTQEFVNILFGIPIVQGYGLTETCAGGTLSNLQDFSIDNTGPPFYCAEIKLIPWQEGGYSPMDTPNPRGEILIGGECVALGYYNNEEMTNESFFVDPKTNTRWFKTGDIGEFCDNGTLKIIDRKKDIVKLKHGEYVSLVLVETIALQSCYVELCCALPNVDSDYIILLVMPNQNALKSNISKFNPELTADSTIDIIIKDENVKSAISEDILSFFTMQNRSKFESPRKIISVSDLWTPESGLLTPSMKVKRTEMKKFYHEILV